MTEQDGIRNLLIRAELEHRWRRFEEGLSGPSTRAILGAPIANREEVPMNSAMKLLRDACAMYASAANSGKPTDEAEIRIDAAFAAFVTPHFQTPAIESIEADNEERVFLHLEGGFMLTVELG